MKSFLAIYAALLLAGILPLGLVSHAGAVTLLGNDWDGNLYTVDASNASLSLIGATGIGSLGALEFAPNGTLYGFNSGSASLYSIDPGTAAASLIGPLSNNSIFEGGLAFSPTGIAYGVNEYDNSHATLFTIDLNSGAITDVGVMGTITDVNGLAWRSDGMLVGIEDNSNSLVTIDPNTGFTSTIAALGFTAGNAGGMTFDPLSGMGYFTTGGNGTNSLYSFDMFSGASNFIGSFGSTPGALGITGLAAVPPSTVPEPATLGLFGLGLVGLISRRKKNRP